MKIYKSVLCFLLCLPLCTRLSACTRSVRIDYSELNRRLKAENKAYAFTETEAFFSDSVYFAFLSLQHENDVLLTMKEDAEKKLTQVTVTAAAEEPKEGFTRVFTDYAAAVIGAFIPETDAGGLETELRKWEALLYTECFRNYECGKYGMRLFSDPIGISVILTRL